MKEVTHRLKNEDYHPKSIEEKWMRIWEEERIYQPNLETAKKPFYNLMMFPYPSAEGLHVGNTYAFTGADIFARFKRMQGFDVFEPIGLDGFGIHSENYAIKIGRTPQEHAKISQQNFYKQLHRIGNSFDWKHKLETYDPKYYKWTQWLFIQLFKTGLAYRKKAPVNYCPSCKTVLADEQVIDGKCERCGSIIEKRNLEQWFFRITKYANRLLNNIDNLSWSEKVKIAQKNWIGKSQGAKIKFALPKGIHLEIFTTRPDTLYGVTFLVVAPEHPIVKTIIDQNIKNTIKTLLDSQENLDKTGNKEKTGVYSGINATHPLTGEKIPIWIADYVLMSYGTGAIMGVPGHDKRDLDFAKKYNLSIKKVLEKDNDTDESVLINSSDWNGLQMPKDMEKVLSDIKRRKIGEPESTFHLRDWLISRQRYWGPPIPMIHCDRCGWQPVAESDLPVLLPELDDWKPTGGGKGPLAKLTSWISVRCPSCKGRAKRETDVSDSFLDSSWYFFRYTSINFTENIFDPLIINKWLPVNIYIGGAEHSVLHLLYARFITMVLYDKKLIQFEEPFTSFYAHGLVIKDGSKMSKSKGNVIVPDEYIDKYGSDTLRCYLMFLGPFNQGGDFRDSGIEGMHRFLKRVWLLGINTDNQSGMDEKRLRKMHKTIKRITDDLTNLRYNTAIATLMDYYNFLSNLEEVCFDEMKIFIKLLAPFAPFLTEELWQMLHLNTNKFSSVHSLPWPTYEKKYLEEKNVTIVVQVNGKARDILIVSINMVEEDLVKMAQEGKAAKFILGKKVKRTLYIPKKVINFVID